ncbi:signal peptide peptidase SppA [Robiginitalea sp. IMCC43444]|uniref:signal peptide peptidase SppA n=1 Tax=Robiginitalea sp. IMCC43444 TaxID=3459121 RepID=UPI00404108FC
MAFLRNLLAAILGTLMAFGIIFFMFIFFASLLDSGSKVAVRSDSVLQVNFPYPIAEYSDTDPEDPFAVLFNGTQGLNEITKAIHLAKEDDRIKGISLNGPYLLAGISQTRAIRNALEDFRESGKFVYAYGDFYMQKDYYLSSVADSIFMNPVGNLDFKGLGAEVLYFADFQEKTGLKMEVVRHGKYKSAVEPFLSDQMSAENREQISELIESIWLQIRQEISDSRGIGVERLDAIAENLEARNAQGAINTGLIDATLYKDEYNRKLAKASGSGEDKPEILNLSDYLVYTKAKRQYSGKDKIAVVFAQGEILYGEGSPEFIGQGMMQKALKKAREDDQIKAVVIRINSPGGSALSSEIIWREIRQTQEKKPVVVSISDVAASGGYYMAVGADQIIAEPTTITGSIGVFMTIPNMGGLSEKIGINAEQVGTNQYSIDYSFFEPMSDGFREVLTEGVEESYQTFLKRVADGRGISLQRADSLAQGRVWSGTQALELGLIDELGGLDRALEVAAELAGVSEFRVQNLPRYKSGLERLMDDLGATAKVSEASLEAQLGSEWAQILKEIRTQLGREGLQARMPYTLKIQ